MAELITPDINDGYVARSLTEFAYRYHISKEAVHRLIKRGSLAATRVSLRPCRGRPQWVVADAGPVVVQKLINELAGREKKRLEEEYFLRVSEVAELLGITSRAVEKLTQYGYLHPQETNLNTGRPGWDVRRRYCMNDVLRYMQHREIRKGISRKKFRTLYADCDLITGQWGRDGVRPGVVAWSRKKAAELFRAAAEQLDVTALKCSNELRATSPAAPASAE